MTKLGFIGTIAIAVFSYTGLGYAEEKASKDGKNHPCHQIKEACKAAGFQKGHAKEEKGLFMNCMKPLMDGQTVAGVNVDPATLAACKEKKEKRKAHKGKKHHGHKDHQDHGADKE